MPTPKTDRALPVIQMTLVQHVNDGWVPSQDTRGWREINPRDIEREVVAQVLIFNINTRSMRVRLWDAETGEFIQANTDKAVTLKDLQSIVYFFRRYGDGLIDELIGK